LGSTDESKARNRAIELAKIQNGMNVLEVAVGTGLAFYEMVKRNPNGRKYGNRPLSRDAEEGRKRLKKLSGVNFTLGTGTPSIFRWRTRPLMY